MIDNLMRAIKFRYGKVSEDELFALSWKKPEHLDVLIEKADGGYYAKINNYKGDNVSTWAPNGEELVRLENELLYDYLEVPVSCREYYGYFLPPADVRKEFSIEIPQKYLNKEIKLARA